MSSPTSPSKPDTKQGDTPPDTVLNPNLPHSLYSKPEKYGIVTLVSLAGLFSPLSANIYLPAIPTISAAFGKSIELINLSVTVYMVLQGVSPMLFGTLGDYLGRRPMFILCLLILTASCVGLALVPTSSYALLMVLRCIQATGSASTIALGAGVVGDISTAEERGSLFGFYNSGPLFAPALAPVIGAALTQHLSWRAIFWFLCIGSASSALVLFLLLPETMVGGGIKKGNLIYSPPISVFGRKASGPASAGTRKKFRNPLTLFLEPDIVLLLLAQGITYAVMYGVTTSISSLFQDVYPFLDVTKIGLCFLPLGGGMIFGSLTSGRLLDRDFERYKASFLDRLSIEEKESLNGDVIRHKDFPLEKARMRLQPFLLLGMVAGTVGFGWSVEKGVNLGVPLVLLILIGYVSIGFMTITSTVLIDLAPQHSASVTACNNLVRCGIGATCVAVIDLMFKAMGIGWTYVVLGGICALTGPLVYITVKIGPGCRARRQRESLSG